MWRNPEAARENDLIACLSAEDHGSLLVSGQEFLRLRTISCNLDRRRQFNNKLQRLPNNNQQKNCHELLLTHLGSNGTYSTSLCFSLNYTVAFLKLPSQEMLTQHSPTEEWKASATLPQDYFNHQLQYSLNTFSGDSLTLASCPIYVSQQHFPGPIFSLEPEVLQICISQEIKLNQHGETSRT